MHHHEAQVIAHRVVDMLAPHCKQIAIAGSIRRQKPQVKDIEIVAIPKEYATGIFGYGLATIVDEWEKVKGDLVYGKTRYTQRILPEGIKLDLFFADEDNWGLIYAIRTGSAEYSHHVLAKTWVRLGYKSVDGYLTREGMRIPVPSESHLFNMLGIPWILPRDREHVEEPIRLRGY